MNVLLLEPPYPRAIPPLGLMKISSYEKAKGNNVKYFQGKKFYRFWSRATIWRSNLKMKDGKIMHYPSLKEIFEYERS